MSDTISIGSGIIRKGVRRLLTLDDWRTHAPPKADVQWKDGRSAKESARSWLNASPDFPPEVADVLRSCPDVDTLRSWQAEPEAKVSFDNYRGPANIDLLIVGEDKAGPLVIAVEAKADEPFGESVNKVLSVAKREREKRSLSKRVDRMEQLATQLGLSLDQDDVLDLRYQLLTVTAAVLSEASRRTAQRAMVIVHEFVTSQTNVDKRGRNARDLDRFLQTAFGCADRLRPGLAVGPFEVKGRPKLYFGKAQTTV